MIFVQYILPPLIIILLLFASGVVAFVEMAIASINKIRLETYLKKDRYKKRANKVLGFINNYNEIITSLVIYNNIVNVLLSTISTVWFSFLFNDMIFLSAFFSFILMTILIIIFGELIPKFLGKKYPERGAIVFSSVIYWLNWSLKPISLPLKKLVKQDENERIFQNEGELRYAINEAGKTGITTKRDQEIITSILDWDETIAKKVMISKKDAIYFDANSSKENLAEKIENINVTRVPLFDHKTEKIIGILNTQKFLINYLKEKENSNLDKFILDFQIFKENEFLREIFYELKSKRQKIGIIVNKNNKFIGIITIEDILETIVGKLYDDEDITKEGIYLLSENNFLVNPNVKIYDFYDKYLKNNPKISDVIKIENNNQSIEDWLKENFKIKKLKIGEKYYFRNIVVWIKEDKNSINQKNQIIIEIDIII
ncbi:CNNM domain-containing protein [Candidatus Hepatoplasma crinochetorum]|uniref:CNNM domain-containing protein n=1 Tax=Candidatus Hepatoplasma crinochetorum TaxID=295596 RepID=UPI003088A74F|nr:MAG: gliding motility protein GldE [Candidatus Hepatoplasma crinochetorum]